MLHHQVAAKTRRERIVLLFHVNGSIMGKGSYNGQLKGISVTLGALTGVYANHVPWYKPQQQSRVADDVALLPPPTPACCTKLHSGSWGHSVHKTTDQHNLELTMPSQVACCRPAAACYSWCSIIPVWVVLASGECSSRG